MDFTNSRPFQWYPFQPQESFTGCDDVRREMIKANKIPVWGEHLSATRSKAKVKKRQRCVQVKSRTKACSGVAIRHLYFRPNSISCPSAHTRTFSQRYSRTLPQNRIFSPVFATSFSIRSPEACIRALAHDDGRIDRNASNDGNRYPNLIDRSCSDSDLPWRLLDECVCMEWCGMSSEARSARGLTS